MLLHGLHEEVPCADDLPCKRQLTRLNAQEFAQTRGQTLHRRGGSDDALGIYALLLGRPRDAVEDAACIAFDRGQRRRNVVEDADEEFPAPRILLLLAFTCTL